MAWLVTEGTWIKSGIASTGTAIYGLLALADLLSIYRAAFDPLYDRR